MKARSILFLVLSFGWTLTTAQDISGKWMGQLLQGKGGLSETYQFEMNLKQRDNIIFGTSTISYDNKKTSGLMQIRGTFDGQYFYYEDIKVLNKKGLPEGALWCIKKCKFELKKKGDQYELAGHWTGKTDFGYCTPGSVKVGKKALKTGEALVIVEDQSSLLSNELMVKTLDDEGKQIAINLELKRKGKGSQKGRSEDGEKVFSLTTGSYHLIAKESGYYDTSQDIEIKEGEGKTEVVIRLKKIRKGDSFEIENLTFDRSQATITQASQETLNTLVEFLRSNPTVQVQINGHTDNVGSNYLNRLLSFNRANAVVAYLVKNGISQSRLTAKGHGSELPIADNNSVAGRAQNRRVEIEIVGLEEEN